MLLLTSSSDLVRIVTGSAVSSITAHASYVDNVSGTITPGRTTLAPITTAGTTTLVAGPGSGQRNVRSIFITNNSSGSSQVTVQHFDGTNSADLMGVTLLAGENLLLDETGSWHHHDAQGAEYFYQGTSKPKYTPATGIIAESFPRQMAVTNSSIGASGTLFLQAIDLEAGMTVSNITFFSATTAAATPTSNGLLFGLFDINRNLLAQCAAQGAWTWPANTKKTLAMTTPYKITQTGTYYVGVLQVATTIATLLGGAAKLNAVIANDAPILHGNSSTGLTTSLPNPAAAITAGTASLYAAVS